MMKHISEFLPNIENLILCDHCDSKKVIKNVAQCWVEWDFDYERQEWSEKPVMINDPIENKHYCKECYEKWCNGDLF